MPHKLIRQAHPACLVFTLMALFLSPPVFSQGTCERIMVQDSTLNNLIDPEGYRTGILGELGRVDTYGNGPQAVVFIAGLGFDGDVIEEYALDHADQFTFYAVTLPGFGDTPAPPAPTDDVSFGQLPWTNAAAEAVERLIDSAGIEEPIMMGHWLTGTQIALWMGLKYPDRVKGIIIASGSGCFVATDTTKFPAHPPLAMRVSSIDTYMVPKWFKTVTRETWDDNNFLPGDYAVNPIRGLRLWREAAEPRLHVWVRYLCEFYAQDVTLQLDNLKVPTLLLRPGLEGNFVDNGMDYMTAYCRTSWEASLKTSKTITEKTIPNSRAFIWFDQPEEFDRVVSEFVSGL